MNNKHNFINKLRSSGLRPTRQRIEICKALYDRQKTFHFTINDLAKIVKKKSKENISLATIYNTVYAFKKKKYLKEISINTNKSYFDTNISNHHHFFNESTDELIDIKNSEVGKVNIKRKIPGKRIKSIEVLVKISD
tara:strand:+ start:1325 stop:1735 length:411 start_codon:yes stop_codon:yes gene_type:complete